MFNNSVIFETSPVFP